MKLKIPLPFFPLLALIILWAIYGFSSSLKNLHSYANQPRKIVMPKKTQLPPQYKCPVHGVIAAETLTIRIEDKINIYCNLCAMQFVVDVFDLNLPKLEKIVAEAKDPNET